MAQNPNTFGFQTTNVTDTDTNTNIANTNLTADDNRTLDMDGNELAIDNAQGFFIGQGTASLEFEVNSEIIIFKSGNKAPDFRIFEDSDNGTNYVKLTCGALAANRTLTMPDATGTIALTSQIPSVPSYTAGDGITLNTLEFDLDATQTIITSITNAALKVGRDADNQIDFSTDNEILFRVGGITEYKMRTDNFEPVTNGGASLGRSNKKWKDLFLASVSTINFDSGDVTITHSANALTLAGGAMTFSDGIADSGTISAGTWSGTAIAVNKGGTGQSSYTNGQILIGNTTGNTLAKSTLTAGTNVTITNGTGAITIASTDTNTEYTAGDGITLNTLEFDLDDVQTKITSITNGALKMGRDADNLIDFATTDNQIVFRVNGANELRITPTSLNPESNDSLALGTSARSFSDLFLADGAAINFNNGDVTITNNVGGFLSFATSNAARGIVIPSRNFQISSSTDGNVASGDIINLGSGTVVKGLAYYIRTDGAWVATDQRAVSSSIGFVAIAMDSGTASNVGMCVRGMVTMATDVGSVGEVIYMQRSGNFSNSASTTSGETNRIMGYCVGATDGQIFFNPSQDWVTIA